MSRLTRLAAAAVTLDALTLDLPAPVPALGYRARRPTLEQVIDAFQPVPRRRDVTCALTSYRYLPDDEAMLAADPGPSNLFKAVRITGAPTDPWPAADLTFTAADLRHAVDRLLGPGRYVQRTNPIHPHDYEHIKAAIAAGRLSLADATRLLTYTVWEPYPLDHPDHPDNRQDRP